MKYVVKYIHLLEREVHCVVVADSEEEAIQKAQDGDVIESDENEAPEQGIETSEYEVVSQEM